MASMTMCVYPCPCSESKTDRAINNKPDRHTVHVSRSAGVDPEIKRSKVKVMWLPAWPWVFDHAACAA